LTLETLRCSLCNPRSATRRYFGFSIASPVESVAKFSMLTSRSNEMYGWDSYFIQVGYPASRLNTYTVPAWLSLLPFTFLL